MMSLYPIHTPRVLPSMNYTWKKLGNTASININHDNCTFSKTNNNIMNGIVHISLHPSSILLYTFLFLVVWVTCSWIVFFNMFVYKALATWGHWKILLFKMSLIPLRRLCNLNQISSLLFSSSISCPLRFIHCICYITRMNFNKYMISIKA